MDAVVLFNALDAVGCIHLQANVARMAGDAKRMKTCNRKHDTVCFIIMLV